MKKTYIGIILIVLSLAGIFGWEFYGRERLMYTEILTVNQNIDAGTVITQDMLASRKTDGASSRSYRVQSVGEVIGKEATGFIPAGAELYPEYFSEIDLVVHEDRGEFVLSIPSNWVVSYPQTIRRGDKVTFLCDGSEILSGITVLYAKSSGNTEVVSDNERLADAANVSLLEVIVDKSQAQLLSELASGNEEELIEPKTFVILYQ